MQDARFCGLKAALRSPLLHRYGLEKPTDGPDLRAAPSQAETFVACRQLKAVEGWTDLGLGDFELRYLRDQQKREVDFLIVRDHQPWFLIEVKLTDAGLSPSPAYFQAQTRAVHAFQVVLNLPYEPADCFKVHHPVVVPVKTFLSQLM